VEFALLLPLFWMLVLGLFTGGRAYNKKLDVTSATREGARFGATLDKTTPSWATKVRDIVVERGAGDIAAADVCVALVTSTATVVSSTSGSQCPDAGDTGADTNLRVQVSAQASDKLEVMIWSKPLTLKAGAVARYEGK
jgi:Flp pilus assembly protein TadG